MFEGIDLCQTPPENICISRTEANIRVESHENMIQPGWKPLDLVYSNISGTHTIALYEAKYYITFFSDVTKRS